MLATLEMSCMILLLVAASNFFGAVFSRLGSATWIAELLLQLDLAPTAMLLLILGGRLRARLAARVGADRADGGADHAAAGAQAGHRHALVLHLVAVCMQTAWLSPPVALSAYFLQGVVPRLELGDIYRGMMQFMVLQVIGLLLLVLFPAAGLYLPRCCAEPGRVFWLAFLPARRVCCKQSGAGGIADVHGHAEVRRSARRSTRCASWCSRLGAGAAGADGGGDRPRRTCSRRELWREMGELGLLGITVPEEYGGAGMGYLAHVVAVEEIARASRKRVIELRGAFEPLRQPDQAERHRGAEARSTCRGWSAGEHVGALAMSEAGAGSDVVSMRLRAEKRNDRYVLNGTKYWITNGPDADTLVVYGKTDPAAGAKGITAFLIEKAMKGFSTSPHFDKLGMRGSNTAELIFEDVRGAVRERARRGGQGRQRADVGARLRAGGAVGDRASG